MKLALIGGGGVRSIYFTKALLKRGKKINITEIALMDNDREKLCIYGNLCKEVARQMGSSVRINQTTNIEEAIEGADYIVTTIRVGQEASRVLDERTALKYGILGQETTGAGGFAMALRTVPVLLDYCGMIKKMNPDAWIFNFTNPSGLVTEAMRQNGYEKVIGICDSPSDLKLQLAKALNLEPEGLSVQFYGLNHLSWIKKLVYDGKDIMPSILQNPKLIAKVQALKVFDPELLGLLQTIPNEYLYYYYHRERALENIISSEYTRGETIEAINKKMLETLKKVDIKKKPKEALDIYYKYNSERMNSYMSIETSKVKKSEELIEETDGYAGVALDFIEAIQHGVVKEMVLSVPNEGSIEGMGYDDVVEITCEVGRGSIVPVKIGKIPQPMLLLMQQVKAYEKYTIKAIMEKSRKYAYIALMLHPLVGSYSIAKKLVDEYLELHKEYVGIWA